MGRTVTTPIIVDREGMAAEGIHCMPPARVERRWRWGIGADGGEGTRANLCPVPFNGGSGRHDGFVLFDCPEPFPLYVARIDDRLLLRSTPDGVRPA
jgi:hypothetical protein